MATWLRGVGVIDDEAEDILVVLSELVTEGISHEGGGDIVVRAVMLEDRRLAIEVVSTPWPEGVTVLRYEPGGDVDRAHRMEIVAAMSDDLAVHHEGGHTLITLTLKVA